MPSKLKKKKLKPFFSLINQTHGNMKQSIMNYSIRDSFFQEVSFLILYPFLPFCDTTRFPAPVLQLCSLPSSCVLPAPSRAAPAAQAPIELHQQTSVWWLCLLSQYGNRTQLKVKSVVGFWLSTQLRGTLTQTPTEWHCHPISSQGGLVKKFPLLYEASSLNESLPHQASLQQDLKTQLLSPRPQNI